MAARAASCSSSACRCFFDFLWWWLAVWEKGRVVVAAGVWCHGVVRRAEAVVVVVVVDRGEVVAVSLVLLLKLLLVLGLLL